MIRIILQWESIILCNIQGIMENGMTLCAITDIMVKVLRGYYGVLWEALYGADETS